eukprot:m.21131 g.21131  ORF g.21131 m.21131 type:complete len:83 (+) comp12310_c1_seq1:301-549(+)
MVVVVFLQLVDTRLPWWAGSAGLVRGGLGGYVQSRAAGGTHGDWHHLTVYSVQFVVLVVVLFTRGAVYMKASVWASKSQVIE